jgi:hypothetical protein
VFKSTSYRFTSGDWQYDHSVDIVIGEGGEQPLLVDDTEAGVTYTAGKVFTEIKILAGSEAEKRWRDDDGWYHGALLADPALLPQLADLLRSRLGSQTE